MLVRVDFNTFRLRFLPSGTIFVHEDDKVWNLFAQEGVVTIKCTVEKSKQVEQNIMFMERLLNSGHGNNIIKVMEADDGYGNKPEIVPQVEETKYSEPQDNSEQDGE